MYGEVDLRVALPLYSLTSTVISTDDGVLRTITGCTNPLLSSML